MEQENAHSNLYKIRRYKPDMPATTIQEANYEFFMEADVSRYIGEWVAVCEERIVAHGHDIKEVTKTAVKACKGKKFLLARVPDRETMIF